VEALIDQLMAGGHLGLFAAFLVWQFVALQKRLDKLVSSFQMQLNEINENYNERTARMRERYDRVIAELQSDLKNETRDFLETRARIEQQITGKLDQLIERQK